MLLIYAVITVLTMSSFARKQTFTATGTLECNGKPAANQKLQLKFTDPLMKAEVAASATTAADGSFKISGTNKARAFQKAYLWIEHNCDSKQRNGCTIMNYVPIPPTYDGRVFSVGKQELSKVVHYNSCDDIDN